MKVYPLFFQAGKSLSSVLVGRDVYPLFQAGKSLSSKVFILEMKIYPLFFQAGKISGHYVLKMSYPLFQAGKVNITC